VSRRTKRGRAMDCVLGFGGIGMWGEDPKEILGFDARNNMGATPQGCIRLNRASIDQNKNSHLTKGWKKGRSLQEKILRGRGGEKTLTAGGDDHEKKKRKNSESFNPAASFPVTPRSRAYRRSYVPLCCGEKHRARTGKKIGRWRGDSLRSMLALGAF